MIEEVAVSVLGGLQLVEELAELDDLIRAELRVLRQFLGVVAVMRDAVMRLRDTDVRVTAVARLVADHEREHPADVTLEGQVPQVVGARLVIVERSRHPERRFGPACYRAETRFHGIELLLDLTDVAEVLVEN